MTRNRSIARQAALRLILSLSLLVALIAVTSVGIYQAALHKAALKRADSLADFYTARLNEIERDWEVRGRDFRVRIENTRALEHPETALTSLQAFMTLQGLERTFQYLIIESEDGEKLFDFGHDFSLPSIPTGAGEDSGYYHDPDDQQIYRVYQYPIWLGEKRDMGRMAVFFRIDNGLLTRMSAPGVTLSALYDGKAISSSGGQQAVDELRRGQIRPRGDREIRELPWTAKAADPIRLRIEAPFTALFSKAELSIAISVIPIVDGLLLWFTIGLWLMRQTRRISALGDVVNDYASSQHVTADMRAKLAAVKRGHADEITKVADSVAEMVVRVQQTNQNLEQLVAERTADLQVAREQAESANRAKSQFLASMSHELRTPLNAILGFSQLIEVDDKLSAESRENAQEIIAAGQHLLELVNEVIDLSRIESGKLDLTIEPVSVSAVLAECLAMVAPLANSHGIKLDITTNAAGQPCASCANAVVRADATRLRQVLINLLSNAIKYNRPHGSVSTTCHLTGAALRICVSDTGPGIPDDMRARLFVAFDRLGMESGSIEGAGVGLAITRRIVEAMGGKIGFESAEGQGSRFWIEFPVEAQCSSCAPQPAATGGTALTSRASGRDANVSAVLYIEDNPMNLRLMQKTLSRRPEFKLHDAPTAEIGIELARATLPDLILMDINLPGMNGYEALQRLKTDPRTAHIPVVAITANAMKGDRERGVAAGFADYLVKPLDIVALLDMLDRMSRLRRWREAGANRMM